MAKLEEYEVNINGIRHTLQLDAESAENIGATKVGARQAAKLEQPVEGAESHSGEAPIQPAVKTHTTPQEKEATSRANKARGGTGDLLNDK